MRFAEQLIATALMGNAPDEIAEELRDLLEQVNFYRHLRIHETELLPSELQMSLTGAEVGYGITLSEIFVQRVRDIEKIIYRTVERLFHREFRERGAANRSIQSGYSLYMKAPVPGSFSVTLQLGKQKELPVFDLSVEVIDEVVDCFQLLNNGEEGLLREKISEEAYFINFINLAKQIAPDGEKVNMVGLTKFRGDKEISVALTRRRSDIQQLNSLNEKKNKETVKVTGRLLFADATKSQKKIQLVEKSNESHLIIVPEGMMDDIVKPLWDEMVEVSGQKIGKELHLREIQKSKQSDE